MGETGDNSPHREEVPEGAQFIARVLLNKEGSVLRSSIAQVRAVEQFSLSKDLKLLEEVPTTGLHFALKSYFLRGVLIEQELFSRLSHAHRLPLEFEQKIAEENRAREAAEKKIKELEAERSKRDGKWQRELEIKDSQIRRLQQHRSKQSTVIDGLKNKLSRLEKEVTERDARIKYLEEEVAMEKRYRLEAQDKDRSERLTTDNAILNFKEERTAHEATQVLLQSLEGGVALLDSQAHKAEVIEEYRQSPLGKVEVALACKAGFDHLASLLPPGFQPLIDNDYLPRVFACLDFLKELETAGGGVSLEVEGEVEGGDDEAEGERQEVAPTTSPSTL